MGLFGGGAAKKAEAEQNAAQKATNQKAAAKIDSADIDLEKAESVIDVLCASIGSPLPQRERVVRRLIGASGMPDPENASALFAALDREGEHYSTRCWRWLNSLARKANEGGRPELAAKVYMWSSVWIGVGFEGGANSANYFRIGIDRCPESEILGIIDSAQIAFQALPDDDLVLSETVKESVTVGMVRSSLISMIELRDSIGIQAVRAKMRQAMR